MNIKKDKMSDALAEFWGNSKDEINTVGIGQDIISPEEASDEMESEGMSIKERAESGIAATQDLTPDQVAARKYMMIQKRAQQEKKDPFDLGGFDAMIKKQMARERGTGMSDIEFGRAGMGIQSRKQQLSYDEKMQREYDALKLKEVKAGSLQAAQQRRLNLLKQRIELAAAQQQARSMQETRSIMNKTYNEDIKRARYAAGLPVTESPWDIIAGGKTRVKKYNEQGVLIGEEFQRQGGLFGAVKEGYGFYKKAMPHVKSGMEKAKVISDTADITLKAPVEGLKIIGDVSLSSGKKVSGFVKEKMASDAKGVFQVAKTNAEKSFKSAKIGVDSYFDNSDIGKTIDSLLEKKPGNTFIDQMQKEHEKQRVTIPKGIETTLINPSYEGRNLNPINITPSSFNFSGSSISPTESPRVAKTQSENYNEKMINDVMGNINKDNDAWYSDKNQIKDLRDV